METTDKGHFYLVIVIFYINYDVLFYNFSGVGKLS